MQRHSVRGEHGGGPPGRRYDVIVLGAGPAGAAAGLALARNGLSVALLGRPTGQPPIGETVPPAIIRPLAQLGLWQTFAAAGHAAAPGNIVLWGDEQPSENEFIFNPYGSGWHLDRVVFDAMLLDAARAAGADIRTATVRDCSRNPAGGWMVALDADGVNALTSRWVIDATGRAAWLAKRAGAKRQLVDRLVALVRFADASRTGEPRTVIEACPDGWWYAAALPRDRIVVALFSDADLLPRGALARQQHWDRSLAMTRLISSLAQPFPAASPIYTVAACSARLVPCAGVNWLAIGDAAQSYDPLSGMGICKALTSALQAADAISDCLARDRATPDDVVQAVERNYRTYLANRLAHYGRERRWPEREFWRRRARGPDAPSAAPHKAGESSSEAASVASGA